MQFQSDYFNAYHNLKLTRDDKGVLVAEFHSNGGPCIMTAQSHTEFVDGFYRISQDRANKIVILTGAGGEFITRLRATCQCNCGGRWRDFPGCGPLLPGRCARRRNFHHLELSRRSGTSGGVPAQPTAARGANRARMGSGCRSCAEWQGAQPGTGIGQVVLEGSRSDPPQYARTFHSTVEGAHCPGSRLWTVA